ncbi:MAG: 2-phospho-L-lactate guanylyltransferase [Thermomicrobiales bacterium]
MREPIVTIVPVRSLRNGKTRLSSVLSPEARAALLRRSAERVIAAATAADVVARTVVVSPDPDVLDWASRLGRGVTPLLQPESRLGLNGAIDAGREWTIDHGFARMFSLFADLPLIAASDLEAMAIRAEPVVLGPDRRGEGTNALLLRLPGDGANFQFAFGAGSLDKHRAAAARLGLQCTTVVLPGIGFDLDTPDDWNDFLEAVAGDAADWSALAACDGVCAR